MLDKIKKALGISPSVNYSFLVKNGAQIVDVRSKGEFSTGHIRGSLNIPVQDLENNLKKLKKDKPVITCCASGMRSASAKSILLKNGFTEVHNGGSWSGLERKL
jgi:rhodanese-related sulfurtransferase